MPATAAMVSPRLFTQPAHPRDDPGTVSLLNDATSFAATIVRAGRGIVPTVTVAQRRPPERLLELWEFENCPYCRKVREVLCELDLDYLAHPLPHGHPGWAQFATREGKHQVPFLVDLNTDTRLFESADIMAYLNATYGNGARAGWPVPLPTLLDDAVSALASGARIGRGTSYRGRPAPGGYRHLTLYNMEGSPYCRKVREVLSELALPYVVRNLPKGSPKRDELVRRGGTMLVPYLVDPNTGREMYESDVITAYLDAEYGAHS
jgi:glutathione S-transferase